MCQIVVLCAFGLNVVPVAREFICCLVPKAMCYDLSCLCVCLFDVCCLVLLLRERLFVIVVWCVRSRIRVFV